MSVWLLGLIVFLIDIINGYEIGSYMAIIKGYDHDIPTYIHYPITNNNDIQFPLFVFGHSYTGDIFWYNYTYEYLVPNGVIVALPGSLPEGPARDYAIDYRYVLDYLMNESMNNITSPIFNRLNGKSCASGHSMGGASAMISLGYNATVVSQYNWKYNFTNVLSLTGCAGSAVMDAFPLYSPDTNIIFLGAKNDCDCPNLVFLDRYYNSLMEGNYNCKYKLMINNASHCGFIFDDNNYNSCIIQEESLCIGNDKDFNTLKPYNILCNIASEYMFEWIFYSLLNDLNDLQNRQNFETQLNLDLNTKILYSLDYNCVD